ncbi:unnamed protein product [Durusdinium trenchii]|uniref:Ankyrin repeat domain-containing protein 17 n=1 Tax=Durusdinium trenchii TaxID=1381693 RepID=A0ABP0L7V3_9DINO
MEIITVAGAVLTQLQEEELGCMVESGKYVRDLKTLIATKIGYSRFRLRLLSKEMGELQDDMPVRPLPSLQLVILDYYAPEEANWHALHFACQNKRVVEVTRLLQKPLNPNWTGADIDLPAPILFAAKRGHLEVVRLLLEAGADQNAARQDGATALGATAFNGHLEVARVLLEAGADPNAARQDGTTALMVAALNGHLEVVRVLLEAGADQNATTQDGATALMFAAHKGHLEVVRLLLEAGADPKAAAQDGTTALILAAESGQLEVQQLLLEAGGHTIRTPPGPGRDRPDRSRSR